MAIVINENDQEIIVVNDANQRITVAGPFSSIVSQAAISSAVEDYIEANPITTGYVHTQSVAMATWTINHNLGRRPNVVLYDDTNTEVEADIVSTTTTVVITMPSPMTGQAILT
ncbi:MAG TPA: hypothetical protein PKJ52_01275 [Rectinema sp.]|nr:hypothetical protein [Rectinema sp.]